MLYTLFSKVVQYFRITTGNMFDTLLSKSSLLKTLKVLSWINRFLSNARKHRLKGQLTTIELWKQRKPIIIKVQLQYVGIKTFNTTQKQLRVKVSEVGLYQCFSRIPGELSYFYPQGVGSSRKISTRSSYLTIHGGVTLTMAKIK